MPRRCDCPRHASARPSRRSVISGLAAAGAAPALAFAAPAEPTAEEDERYMRIATAEAERADFPFGAVIVRE